jgi:hypothetical protein
LAEKRFVYLPPAAVKDRAPRSSLPCALLGVRYVHVAEPFPARPTPFSFARPAVAEHATRSGRAGLPPAVIRTEATTVAPALGFAGESLTRPTLAPPALGGGGGDDASVTSTVTEALSFAGSGSGSEAETISARST